MNSSVKPGPQQSAPSGMNLPHAQVFHKHTVARMESTAFVRAASCVYKMTSSHGETQIT